MHVVVVMWAEPEAASPFNFTLTEGKKINTNEELFNPKRQVNVWMGNLKKKLIPYLLAFNHITLDVVTWVLCS